jgi:hypothetical protein
MGSIRLAFDGHMRKLSAQLLASASFVVCASANADAYLPDKVDVLVEAKTHGCGIRADYQLTDGTMRVEVVLSRIANSYSVASRAYQPNAVGPGIRDIWLRTNSLFTLGRFRAAKENGNGILEASGDLTLEEGNILFADLKKGDLEISLIFDGAMPAARFAVGLPSPLPSDVISDLDRCAS